MYLNFETLDSYISDISVPQLANLEGLNESCSVKGVKIDGTDVEMDDSIVRRLSEVVFRMRTEQLPERHFRDCNHFVMAMEGHWLTTAVMYNRNRYVDVECNDETSDIEHTGPVAFGIPNDDRCLGFGNMKYVYHHTVLGVDSSVGKLCMAKIGINNIYTLSTFESALKDYDLEVSHPINRFKIISGDTDIFSWSALKGKS